MKISPIYFCRLCGKPLFAQLKTAVPDEDGELLYKLMPGVKKIAFCKACRKKVEWYRNQGRGDEIEGMLRPVEGKWQKKPVERQ